MKFFVLFCFLISGSAFAKELSLKPYLDVQEALAKDDYKSALASHKSLCDKEGKELAGQYKDCKKAFKSIEELRESFKVLSQVYIEKGSKEEMKGLTKATCPMAQAKWIQKNGTLANPYYGKSMLECGEKI